MEAAQKVISAVRALRSDYGLTKEKPTVSLACSDATVAAGLRESAAEIATLSTSSAVTVLDVRHPSRPMFASRTLRRHPRQRGEVCGPVAQARRAIPKCAPVVVNR